MMSRRRLVALVSALLMLTIGAGLVGGFVLATQSERGRELIRRLAEAQLSRMVQGRVHVGTLSGSFLTDLRVDSLRIADADDSLFVATGPVRVTYDPRDLADGRIILRSVEIERPLVQVRREFNGDWTHQKLWPPSPVRRSLRRQSRFGAVFLLEQASVRDGEFDLLMPWAPDSAPRDSITRAWRWQNIALDLPRARLAYPDSVGLRFTVGNLDVDESDPPFSIRGLHGDVRVEGDTVFVDVPRLSLPGSVASGRGRVYWGHREPVRYDLRIESDSVSLADIAWISPAIPTEGGGRMRLDIRSDADPSVVNYVITQMDLRTHRSRLQGDMTWGVGRADELALRNVDLRMDPLDTRLLERFNQGPLAVPLRGELRGRLRARGGPLERFVVDDATATYRDRNVPGATARAQARGTVDIRDMGTPVFYGVDLTVANFDLRSAQALEPDLPRLNGSIRGSARLDSAWGALRVSDADLRHRDGDSEESRLRGSIGLSWDAESPVRWSVDLAALPLSFGALAQSFPAFPLRGLYSGPLRTTGTASDFTLVADLLGDGGRLETDVRFDTKLPTQRVVGRATLTGVDPRTLLESERVPSGELTAYLSLDAQWDSLANLTGNAQLNVDRSLLEGARIFTGTARLNFTDGRALVDTLYLESSAVDLSARGGLGLVAGVDDSLTLRARADSLGGLRWWLRREAGDSLAGAVRVDALARGSLRDFTLTARGTGEGLLLAGNTAQRIAADATLRGLPTRMDGSISVDSDTLRLAGLALRDARVTAERDSSGVTEIRAIARGPSGTSLTAAGSLDIRSDTTRVDVRNLTLTTDLQRWTLGGPSRFAIADGGFALDSLALRAAGRAALVLRGALPATGALDLQLAGTDIPVADVAELLQHEGVAQGRFDLRAQLGGTRERPSVDANAELRAGLVRGVRLDTLRAVAQGGAERLGLRLDLGDRRRPSLVAQADLPFRLGFSSGAFGMNPDGAIGGSVRADSLPLDVLETLTRGATGARGSMAVNLTLAGTWSRPLATGGIRVRNGFLAPAPLGDVRWRNVEADIAFFGDSIAIRNVAATSGPSRSGRAAIAGWVSLRNRENPRLDLTLTSRGFHAFARPQVADIDISGDLRLDGAWRGATLRGALTADRALITIPELASKDVISLEGPDRFGAVDTLVMADTRVAAGAPPDFVDNLTIANVPIRMGRDVWLRSEEANINLGGEVSITRGRVTRGLNAGELQLALVGPLQTQRGTYRLNLGPVQRTFEVEQGEIRFFGDPELNPTLDISALHIVRQYSEQGVRPDVRVRVHMGGTLRQPTLELSSPDSLRVTNADLISYLVTGGPSFEIGGRNGDVTATAARVVLGSLGSVLGGKAAGGLCDDAQVSTAGLDQYGGRFRSVGGGILAGTRFNCAKQVGERAFVRLDAGLCQVGQLVSQGGGGDPLSFTDALGLKLDYLLGRGLSASVGVEPPTSAVLCAVNANASARGFVPTPRQVGFDLFRVWRF